MLRNYHTFYVFSHSFTMSALFQFSLDSGSYFGKYKEMKCLIKDTFGVESDCTI